MRNVIGQPVIGDDLYGREYELLRVWELLEQGEHILMLAPRRVGKTSLMLELQRAPHEDWDVLYVDVEGGDSPANCVAAILAALAADPRYRSQFEALPFSSAIKDVFTRVSIGVDIEMLRIELKDAIGRDWDRAADQLQARMLRTGGHRVAELLLSRLRHWRQSPELRGRVHTLVGGSIGLEGVLRRAGVPGSINDLAPFHLDSWDRSTATDFLTALGRSGDFHLDNDAIVQVLDLLQDPVPYHVQLFFSALQDACKGIPSRVSPESIESCFRNRLAGPSGTAHLDHYATRLETALDERGYELAREILSHACRRRDGATIGELTELVESDERTFHAVLHDVEADGYLTREDNRLTFRSNLLREWWRRHHGRGIEP